MPQLFNCLLSFHDQLQSIFSLLTAVTQILQKDRNDRFALEGAARSTDNGDEKLEYLFSQGQELVTVEKMQEILIAAASHDSVKEFEVGLLLV